MDKKNQKNVNVTETNASAGQLLYMSNTTENGTLPALPFVLGYSCEQRCRLSHFFDDGESIRCLVNNADGVVQGRIRRPDISKEDLQEWALYSVTIVLMREEDTYTAEILSLQACSCIENSLEYVPRILSPVPAKLDQLRHLIQLIQSKNLRLLVSLIYGKPHIYERFLTAYGSRDSYTYPGGLLTRTVAAGKHAIRMGFQTQIEADVVLACALLYDIGRVLEPNLTLDDNRTLLGFAPHKKTIEVVEGELDTRDPIELSLIDILSTGYSAQYPSLHPDLKQHAAIAKIDTLVRVDPIKKLNQ